MDTESYRLITQVHNLTENILMDGHTFAKRCFALKFDGLNFDGLDGKCHNSPRQNFLLYGIQ